MRSHVLQVRLHVPEMGLRLVVQRTPITDENPDAELERTTIVDRLQSGRKLALEKGAFKPGRPDGTGMTKEDLLAKYPRAVKRLKAGRTIREVAGECGLSTKTVQKIKNALKED